MQPILQRTRGVRKWLHICKNYSENYVFWGSWTFLENPKLFTKKRNSKKYVISHQNDLMVRRLFDFELLTKRFTIHVLSSVALVNGNFKMKLFQGNLLRKSCSHGPPNGLASNPLLSKRFWYRLSWFKLWFIDWLMIIDCRWLT